MVKKFNVKVLAVLLLAFVMTAFSTNSSALPAEAYYVGSEDELKSAISRSYNYDYIKFTNDIEVKTNLYIDKSLIIDLGGHCLYLGRGNSSILVGNKVLSYREPHEIKKPGYYTYEDRVEYIPGGETIIEDSSGNYYIVKDELQTKIVTDKVWHPGTVEIEYKDVYNYYDGIEVTIKNGVIRHIDGVNGQDGINDTWEDYNGKNGETPSEVIRVISGTVKLYDVVAYGGYGGNGGDGKSQALVHIPFGGGDGGNGGRGGNGGDVVNLTRKECDVLLYGSTNLVPGKGGKGGKRGPENPNYWLYPGFDGYDGKNGKDGVSIRKV